MKTCKEESDLGGLHLRVARTLDLERISLLPPHEHSVRQFPQILTMMIPGDVLMEVPPHALDRVVVRRVAGEQVNLDPALMLPAVLDHFVVGMEAHVITDHVIFLYRRNRLRRSSNKCSRKNSTA